MIQSSSPLPLLLAIEDTTTLSYQHRSIRADLGHVNQGNRYRGLLAHGILLFSPETLDVVGLIEQQRWTKHQDSRYPFQAPQATL